jgi:Tol biopolymer transport system component
MDEDRIRNPDVWIIDLAHPDKPIQVTTNGSIDDNPVWDPSGDAIYFRSNRGGQWGIWKISIK